MTPNGVKLATQNTINALALKTSELVNFPLEAGLITKKVQITASMSTGQYAMKKNLARIQQKTEIAGGTAALAHRQLSPKFQPQT